MNRANVKRKGVKRKGAWTRAVIVLFAFYVLPYSPLASAQPTQDEVLKSIGENVGQPVESSHVIGALAAIGGAVVLLVVVGQWSGRERKSKGLNHHGKLLKEVLRNVPLKSAELKQIKLLAQDLRPGGTGGRVESPLTLLLCPSLLAEAAKQNRSKVDLPVVAGLVKKLVTRP